MNFAKWLIRTIFWLQAFIGPVILMVVISFAINKASLFLPLIIIGGVIGIILAEFIRRRFGLETFFARIYGPNEVDEKLKKKD